MKRYIRSAIQSFDREPWRDQVSIASNPNASARDLITWSNSSLTSVRMAVAGNPNCPKEVMQKLVSDDSFEVRGALAHNPSTPVNLLVTLAKDPYDLAAQYAINNPNATEEVYRTAAANCRDLNTAGIILDNKNVGVEALRALLNNSLAQRSQWIRESCRRLIAEKEQKI